MNVTGINRGLAEIGALKGTSVLSRLSTAEVGMSFRASLSEAKSRESQAREAAAQFVGMAFIQPLLARMHESPFMSERFAPGEGERRFQPLLDAQVSDGIARAASFPLTEAVADRLLGTADRKGTVHHD